MPKPATPQTNEAPERKSLMISPALHRKLTAQAKKERRSIGIVAEDILSAAFRPVKHVGFSGPV